MTLLVLVFAANFVFTFIGPSLLLAIVLASLVKTRLIHDCIMNFLVV